MSGDPTRFAHLAALKTIDPETYELLVAEEVRQHRKIRLIPSENYVSLGVLQASASVLSNKYSEGYPKRRYYEGQQITDALEIMARKRAKALFGSESANVQPYSGSPANLAVYLAFAEPGDAIMGLSLAAGGHLTHGHGVAVSGRWFRSFPYGVRKDDQRIDFDQIVTLAREHKPKIIFAGGTAYPRTIDFARFEEIAKEVGAYFVADIAHISGLVVAGAHPSPVPHADVVTSTTHKTLRGPRGGLILSRKAHSKAINRAVFPGLQGGPHMHQIAALNVALAEARRPEFAEYGHQVVRNAKAMAEAMLSAGFELVSGGTDNHLILCDLTSKGVTGKVAAQALDRAGIVLNYNSVPFDPRKPFDPSGVRLGSPAVTSRGMKEDEMRTIAGWIDAVVKTPDDEGLQSRIAAEAAMLCDDFPAPGLEHLHGFKGSAGALRVQGA